MAKALPQTTTVMNADVTALQTILTAAQTARKAPAATTNSLDIQHLDKYIKQLKAVIDTAKLRVSRAAY